MACRYLTWAWDLPGGQVPKADDGMPMSGGRYTGTFLAGMRHGTGFEMQPGRGVYKGEWVEDARDGAGSYKWPNGDHFVGQWAGELCSIVSAIVSALCTMLALSRASGEHPKASRCLACKANGARVSAVDKRDGNGMFQWADGSKFEGLFRKDVPVEGRLFEKDGSVSLPVRSPCCPPAPQL